MITITTEQLMAATYSGALRRFFECELSITAWKSLRHTASSCEKEMDLFQKKRDEMVAKHEGAVHSSNKGWNFPDAEKTSAFLAEWNELMKIVIDNIPGDPIRLDDIRNGSLAAADHQLLKPFIAG